MQKKNISCSNRSSLAIAIERWQADGRRLLKAGNLFLDVLELVDGELMWSGQ